MFYILQSMRRAWAKLWGERLILQLDQETHHLLQRRALLERTYETELANAIISGELRRMETDDELYQRWNALTPRQQHVTALACAGYTSQEIAVQLSISPNTVRAHQSNILKVFDFHRSSQLQIALANWDFSAWESKPEHTGLK